MDGSGTVDMECALASHYENHNVKGMKLFVSELNKPIQNERPRFVRLNTRFDVDETLKLFKVRDSRLSTI